MHGDVVSHDPPAVVFLSPHEDQRRWILSRQPKLKKCAAVIAVRFAARDGERPTTGQPVPAVELFRNVIGTVDQNGVDSKLFVPAALCQPAGLL